MVRGPAFLGDERVSRHKSDAMPDAEYAAAYAVRTQSPGNQPLCARGGRVRTAAISAPATKYGRF